MTEPSAARFRGQDVVRTIWRWARPVGGLLVLVLVGLHVGAGPFLDGLGKVDVAAVAAALALTALTTFASAWRWSRVAHALGVPVSLNAAVAAYYRSQLLNSVLPGGVVGDVERGVRHGQEAGRVRRSLAAVATERGLGQVVQLFLAAVVLAVVPSPWPRGVALAAAGAVAVAALVATLAVRRRMPALGGELPAIVVASVLVVIGHCATFVVAARAVGVTDLGTVVPIAFVVLVAMSVPVNVGGWGPREGVAGWAFAAAGLGTGTGVTVAVVYGVITLVAVLPGVATLVRARHRPAFGMRRPAHG